MNFQRNKPKHEPAPCLSGFEHINRFWDPRRDTYTAKILPGEFYVSRNKEAIATTLGSCVSACIWDESSGIGGMNHFMLPVTEQESTKVQWGNELSDATRYGNYAMEHLINEVLKNGGLRKNLKAKVFGGGHILQQMNNVGDKNSDFVLQYLEIEKIPVLSKDLRDIYPRKVLFEPTTGKALIKRLKSLHNETIAERETDYRSHITHDSIDGDIELF